MGIESITINQNEIKRVLRIVTLFGLVIILSFILLFYGIFSAESYISTVLCVTLAIYILLPISFRCCPHLQQSMVFQPHVDSSGVDFEKPEGLKGVRNLILTAQHGINLGIWHLLPSNLCEESEGKESSFWRESIRQSNHKGVIVYFHGVTGTRGKPHRKELYKVLQNHDHHIISCDYRGFADSTKVKRISETSVVADALSVYKWVKYELLKGCENVPVFIWGHSLGAGISTHVVRKLREDMHLTPSGLVLESPFDNFAEELRNHRKLKIWTRLPWFDFLFVKPLLKNDIVFQNDGHIVKIPVPIMIIHAKDDNVVPSQLGRKLFEVGKQRRSPESNPLYFVHMNAGKHNEMYKANADMFVQVVKSFVNSCVSCEHEWHQKFSQLGLEILSSHS